MPRRRQLAPCTVNGCPELTRESTCPAHTTEAATARARRRPSAAQRGYGPAWRRLMARWLPGKTCVDCGQPAEVGDHDPIPRRELVAAGVPDPDDPAYLRPRCIPCHNSRTARERR